MGVKGIALATLCSQLFGLIYIVMKVNKTNLKKFLYPQCFVPKYNLQKEILTQAVPATISMMFIGLGVFVLLFYVSTYGDYSAGGYGAAIRFEQLFSITCFRLKCIYSCFSWSKFWCYEFLVEFMRPIISQFFMELSLWLYVDYLFSFYQTTSCTFLAIIKKLFLWINYLRSLHLPDLAIQFSLFLQHYFKDLKSRINQMNN